MFDFFGTRMIVDNFKQGRMMDCARDWLKMFVKTPASWFAQHHSSNTIKFWSFSGVHHPQCAPHLMFLNSEVVAAMVVRMEFLCLR